jgi:hypothetical protein
MSDKKLTTFDERVLLFPSDEKNPCTKNAITAIVAITPYVKFSMSL